MSHQVISLDAVARRQTAAEMRKALGEGGCAARQCGSAAPRDTLPAELWDKVEDHPCYSEEAHHYFARVHVAVAPACNIQCNYCNRKYDCANESRPGVTSERLSPQQALIKIMAVAARVPQLSVLGIAGPGDALADWRNTFETFAMVREKLPDIKLCLSTNGLALPDHVERIKGFGIDHVTITVNCVDPAIGERIYPWIFFDHRRITGREGAAILLRRQMEGLEKLVGAGILVKVNSVLMPGINDTHLTAVNAEIRKRGAFLHNVMPLISDPAHGTAFGLAGQRGPTPAELKQVQDALGGDARLMRHCRQCRADAVGLLGSDCGQDFALDRLPETPVEDSPEPRRLYRELVERERADRAAAASRAAAALRGPDDGQRMLVAVCTQGGGRVNQHFGKATEFQIFEVDRNGIRFAGHRRADPYCVGGAGEDERLEQAIAALAGVSAVLCAKIGACPRARLEDAGILPVDDYPYEYIETAVGAVFRAGLDAAAPDTLTA